MLTKADAFTKGYWKAKVDLSPPALAQARATELGEMSKDFWSARSERYHTRRANFVRKAKATQTPLRFATHRRQTPGGLALDEEELDSFDDVTYYEKLAARRASVNLRDLVREELGVLVSQWAVNDVRPQAWAGGAVGLSVEEETASLAFPGRGRKMSTVFSCYYKPVDATEDVPPTPAEEKQVALPAPKVATTPDEKHVPGAPPIVNGLITPPITPDEEQCPKSLASVPV
jgi:hypothetical protein